MAVFSNVEVEALANLYFDGKVSSRTLTFGDGERKTLGIMLPGEYTFSTELEELMQIQAGKVEVDLPNLTERITVSAGESFEVPANSSFNIKVLEPTDYCCSYFK